MSGFLQSYLERAKSILSLMRLKPFDDTGQESRSKERYRRIALSSGAAIAARGIGVVTSLISVPLTLHYLGTEQYGLWMTISSVIAALAFADLGMGNGLVNAISEAHGRSDNTSIQKSVSSAFFLLSGIASIMLLLVGSSYYFIPWDRVYNLNSASAIKDAGPTTVIIIIGFALNMPLGIVQRVQMGYQEGYLGNFWTGCGAIFGLLAVLLAIYCEAGLPWLALAMTGGPLLATLLNWHYLFSRPRRWLLPKWRNFDRFTSAILAKTGGMFLVLQVCAVLGNASDNIVIAHVIGVSAVSGYAVTQKLFSITQIAQYFIAPLWPAFGEAMARNDYAWAHRALNRALLFSAVLGLFSALPLCIYGKQIIAIWVGTQMEPSSMLLVGFGFSVLLAGYGGVMSAFLNNGVLLRGQTRFYMAASLFALALKLALAAKFNVAGVIWATVIGYGLLYAIPAARLAYRSVKVASPDASTST